MRNVVMRVLVAVLALGGLFVSVRALQVHNMEDGAAPPCAVSEKWDCGIVNHSRYSVFPARSFDEAPGTTHVPVAVVGIAGYTLLFLVGALGWWKVELPLALIGFGTACFLSYLEAYKLQKWCIYCVWSQSLIATLLLVTIAALVLRRSELRRG